MGAALAGSVLDREQAEWVLAQHERWDGAGRPGGAAGDAIAEEAQLLALADAWDAMTGDRPHRSALTPAEAMAEITRGRTGFHPDAGDFLLARARAWLAAG